MGRLEKKGDHNHIPTFTNTSWYNENSLFRCTSPHSHTPPKRFLYLSFKHKRRSQSATQMPCHALQLCMKKKRRRPKMHCFPSSCQLSWHPSTAQSPPLFLSPPLMNPESRAINNPSITLPAFPLPIHSLISSSGYISPPTNPTSNPHSGPPYAGHPPLLLSLKRTCSKHRSAR